MKKRLLALLLTVIILLSSSVIVYGDLTGGGPIDTDHIGIEPEDVLLCDDAADLEE